MGKIEGDSHFTDHPNWCAEIEKGLENHFRLAGHQIARAMVCLPCWKTSFANKQEVVKEIFREYRIILECIEDWPTDPIIKLLGNDRLDYDELARELGSAYGVVFDDEHGDTMLEELETMDPTKPSYQHNKEIMGIDISQPPPPPMEEDDSKQPAKEDSV